MCQINVKYNDEWLSGFMVSISNVGFWIGAITVKKTASVLASSSLNLSGTLFLFAALTFVLFLYILLLLPETKVKATLMT